MALNHITDSTGTIMNRYTLTHADNTTEDVRLSFKPSDDYVAGSPFNAATMNPIIDAVNSIFPVGSIYMSVNSANPSTYFGGTWEQIKDTFLLSAGDTYAGGTTGGSASNSHTHTLSHTHSVTPTGSVGNHTLTIAEIPSHSHGGVVPPAGRGVNPNGGDWTLNWYGSGSTSATGGSGGHNHPLTLNSVTSGGASTSTTSGASNTNNMPPYLAVYMWKRTA